MRGGKGGRGELGAELNRAGPELDLMDVLRVLEQSL